MAQRCWRLTWPTRSDRLLNEESQFAHIQGKDGTEVELRAKGEGAWSCGENGGNDGDEDALEAIEESEIRA